MIHECRVRQRLADHHQRHDVIERVVQSPCRCSASDDSEDRNDPKCDGKRQGPCTAGREFPHMQDAFVPPPMTPAQRREVLSMRKWRPDERRVVRRGLFGRLTIAVEPAIIAVLFAWFGYWIATHGRSDATHNDWIFSIIFWPGAAAFAVYALLLMAAPIRALRETYEPIFVVDGYLRTRGRDDFSASGTNGYVAVLTEERRVACEWSTHGRGELHFALEPAMLEFSEYGGIHAIDGKKTGVLPDDFPVLGVGANKLH